jgi:Holliday junction resolvase RusA-like endonuclease
VILDIPFPPSVNRFRRIDWKNHKALVEWRRRCDQFALAQHINPLRDGERGQYEVRITLKDAGRIDPDNGIKALLDYLVRIEAVKDDSRFYLRRLVLEFGEAPEGVRVKIHEFGVGSDVCRDAN